MAAEKTVVWLTGESVKSPPLSRETRLETRGWVSNLEAAEWRVANSPLLSAYAFGREAVS